MSPEPSIMHETDLQGSVTVTVSRCVKPGMESDYEAWVHNISKTASSFKGYLGTNVLRPNKTGNNQYVIIYRFDNYEHAQAWEDSPQRKQWIDQVESLVTGEGQRKKVTGFEFWFDLPSVPAAAHAPKHKMAIIMIVVVYTLVLSLSTLLSPIIGEFAFWQKLLVIIPTQVLLMTYIVMPKVTAWLKGWIYR